MKPGIHRLRKSVNNNTFNAEEFAADIATIAAQDASMAALFNRMIHAELCIFSEAVDRSPFPDNVAFPFRTKEDRLYGQDT